jgi:hypothetical protein
MSHNYQIFALLDHSNLQILHINIHKNKVNINWLVHVRNYAQYPQKLNLTWNWTQSTVPYPAKGTVNGIVNAYSRNPPSPPPKKMCISVKISIFLRLQ